MCPISELADGTESGFGVGARNCGVELWTEPGIRNISSKPSPEGVKPMDGGATRGPIPEGIDDRVLAKADFEWLTGTCGRTAMGTGEGMLVSDPIANRL
jgi:hypothetical protein